MANIMNYSDRKKALKNYFGGKLSNYEGNMLNDLSNLDLYGKGIGNEDYPEPSNKKGYTKWMTPVISVLLATAATLGCTGNDNNPSDSNDASDKSVQRDYPNSSDVDESKTSDKSTVSDSLSKDEFSKDFYSSLNKGDNITLMTSRGEITGKVKDLISSDYRFAIKINGADGSYVRMIDTFESDKRMESLILDKYKKYNVKNLVIERFDIDKDFKFDLLKSYINLKQNRNGTIDYGSGMELFDGKDNNFKRLTPSLLFKVCSSEYGDDPGEKHGLTPQDKIDFGCKITE